MTSKTQTATPQQPQAGNKAPDFTLQVAEDTSISLKDLVGKNVVLYFYPKDDTPGCTIEAKDFRDLIKEFDRTSTVVIGVSRDDLNSHQKFKEKFCLPFPLGADTDGSVCSDYGVWVEKSMYGKKYMGIERATFLIDGTGTIRRTWPKVKVEGHVKEVLEAVKSL